MAIICGLVVEGRKERVPLKAVDVTVHVQGIVANIEARLKYRNCGAAPLEVIYVFPVDDDSAVYRCEADIDGRHIVAEIQDKEQARETYEYAVSRGQSAVLLEEHDTAGDVFRCKLGNLPPNSDAVITFAFVTELSQEPGGRLKFFLPSVLTPRYNPSLEDGGTEEDTGFGNNINNCPYDLTFQATVSSKCAISRVWSDTDQLKTRLTSGTINTMKIQLVETFDLKHNISFNVLYEAGNNLHATIEKGKDGIEGTLMSQDLLMLSFYPALSSVESTNAEFVFVLDRSGSMGGQPIKNAKEAMLYFLKSLPVDCYFNIISFGSSYSALFPSGSVRYSEETLKQAMDLQKQISADMGGTEILRPLEFVFRKQPQPGYTRQVFLLTDGEVSNAREVISLVQRNSFDSRVFTVGIGEGVSTTLVRNVAKAGGGQAEFVMGKDRLQQKVVKLLQSANQTSVTNLCLDLELPEGLKVTMKLPEKMPTLFNGQRSNIFVFIEGKASQRASTRGEAILKGHMTGKDFLSKITFDMVSDAVSTSGQFVHRMAVKSVIKDLELQELNSGEKEREIIEASMAGNIVSKYTSFVGVDTPTPKQKSFFSKLLPKRLPILSTRRINASMPRLNSPPSRRFKTNVYDSFRSCSYTYAVQPCDYDDYDDEREEIYSMDAPPDYDDEPEEVYSWGDADEDLTTSEYPLCTLVDGCTLSPKSSVSASDLVLLQKFDGSWSLSKQLASSVGIPLQTLVDKASGFDPQLWATAVAVCWLMLKCPDEEVEWSMVASKAKTWLLSQLGDQLQVDRVLSRAKTSVFNSN